MPKLIVTGSEGRIGKILCKNLSDDFDVYKVDNSIVFNKKYFRADISNFDSLKSAFLKIGKTRFLIHLAADSDENAKWDSVLKNNIIGTRNVYECARLFKIQKVIFASSNHVTGGYEGIPTKLHKQTRPQLITTQDSIRPDGYYGTSKAFGEALARQYLELFGIYSICLRIGTVRDHDDPMKDKTKRWLKTWLSHRDLTQLFKKSLTSNVKFGVYYGVSNNKGKFWDISNAKKEIGYNPIDDSSKLI